MYDFYNNVAAIGMVLVFTKVTSNRLRQRGPSREHTGAFMVAIHVAGVLTGVAAAALALYATAVRSPPDMRWPSAVALGLSAVCLLLDTFAYDVLKRPPGATD